MWKRINHWMTKGFIYAYAILPPEQLVAQCKVFMENRKGEDCVRTDRSLYQELCRKTDEGIRDVLDNYRSCNDDRVEVKDNIKNLKHALQVANDRTASGEAYDPNAPVYNEKTCVEFHHLLIGVLLGYGKALYRRLETSKAERERKDDEPQTALLAKSQKAKRYVWTYCQLLWRIVSSQLFSDHMEALKMPRVDVMHNPERKHSDFYSGWVNYEGSGVRKAGLTLDDDDDDDESDLEEELDREEDDDPTLQTKHAKAFTSLMHLNISHFTALNVLAAGAKNVDNVAISLIVVSQDRYRERVLDWHSTIKNLPPSKNFDADSAIALLQSHLDNRDSCHRIVQYFGKTPVPTEEITSDSRPSQPKKLEHLNPGQLAFSGNHHCEAIFATLFKYVDSIAGIEKSILDLIKVW
jgi:hypothetical protein